MLPILETPSFLGGLGKGLSVGIPQGVQSITDMLQTRKKEKMIQSILNPQSQQQQSTQGSPVDKDELFRNLAMNIEQETGQDLQPADLDKLWQQIQSSPIGPEAGMQQQNQPGQWTDQQILAMQKVDPNTANLMSRMQATQQKERSSQQKQLIETHKLSQKYRSEINQGSQAAKTSNMILDRMEILNKEGKLTNPLVAKLSDQLGIPISILSNPESEEFEKLSNNLTREISQVFKGRILASEFENFLKQIPTLMNSEEGRNRVIQSIKMLNEPKIEQAKLSREIIKENNGIPPFDLEDQVSERMNEYLDDLAQKFKGDSNKSIPKKSLNEIFGK